MDVPSGYISLVLVAFRRRPTLCIRLKHSYCLFFQHQSSCEDFERELGDPLFVLQFKVKPSFHWELGTWRSSFVVSRRTIIRCVLGVFRRVEGSCIGASVQLATSSTSHQLSTIPHREDRDPSPYHQSNGETQGG